jgi:hypothetical protein
MCFKSITREPYVVWEPITTKMKASVAASTSSRACPVSGSLDMA